MIPMLDIRQFGVLQANFSPISCGNRTDLFKKERRHWWLSLGLDITHGGDGRNLPAMIKLCERCGIGHASTL
jgi:hypothetical protein